MGIIKFSKIEEFYRRLGVKQLYVKELAPKQDNDKNQIYFGTGGTNSVLNLLPCNIESGSVSKSKKKRKSSSGKPKIEAYMNFYWLGDDGATYSAPQAKLIYYFQYPEVRFSGFLTGCEQPPDCLRRRSQEVYGKRIIVLGFNEEGKVFGLTLTERDDPVVESFPNLAPHDSIKIFNTHIIDAEIPLKPAEMLTKEINDICGKWHPSITLKDTNTGPFPFKGTQGGGFTLEALLGIPRNSLKTPDKYGFEIKTFKKNGRISLFTPTADIGEEGRLSFREFMTKYGRVSADLSGKIVFNGIHRYGKKNKQTGLVLGIKGYRADTDEFVESDTSKIFIGLFSEISEKLISGWSFEKLLNSWNKKHTSACYVEYESREFSRNNKHDKEYYFTGRIIIGSGTSISNYFRNVEQKFIYYDPGHSIKKSGEAKVRPQWRMSVTSKLADQLGKLYDEVKELSLSGK